ncbi:MAG TPA: hypothetical protein VK492_18515 [Chitinophagaceae bacterium]|nr:hypothetical protein [Chitinophagaceae bacterium]
MNTIFYRTILVSIIVQFSIETNGQTKSDADSIIIKNLNVIEKYISSPNSSSLPDMNIYISFFTNLTGIPSESDGDYIGQHNPTKKDFESWYVWYVYNKKNLSWDNDAKVIVLNIRISPPKY